MAAGKRDTEKRFGLRYASGLANNLSEELPPGFRLEGWRMNRTGAGRRARTLLRDGGKAPLVAAEPLHHPHHAVVLAMPAAAGRKIGLRIGAKQRRDQRPAEHHHQRKCDRAAHSQAKSNRGGHRPLVSADTPHKCRAMLAASRSNPVCSTNWISRAVPAPILAGACGTLGLFLVARNPRLSWVIRGERRCRREGFWPRAKSPRRSHTCRKGPPGAGES